MFNPIIRQLSHTMCGNPVREHTKEIHAELRKEKRKKRAIYNFQGQPRGFTEWRTT